MNKLFFLFLYLLALKKECHSQEIDTTISSLCIGNEHYKAESNFKRLPGVSQSAIKVSRIFKTFCDTSKFLVSNNNKTLDKSEICSGISEFIGMVTSQPNKFSIGIIYYVGHGITTLNGDAYLTPGSLGMNLIDKHFEEIQEQMVSIDTIRQMIINAQRRFPDSKFIVIADCCSDNIPSSLYNGIMYQFESHDRRTLQYDSNSLYNPQIKNALRNSSELTIDSLINDNVERSSNTMISTINEFPNVGAWVRGISFKDKNIMVYSSKFGEQAFLSEDPYNNSAPMGPLGRRTLLYFRKINKNIDDWLEKISEQSFDRATKPALLLRASE